MQFQRQLQILNNKDVRILVIIFNFEASLDIFLESSFLNIQNLIIKMLKQSKQTNILYYVKLLIPALYYNLQIYTTIKYLFHNIQAQKQSNIIICLSYKLLNLILWHLINSINMSISYEQQVQPFQQQQNSYILQQQQQQNTQKHEQFRSQCFKQYYRYLYLLKKTDNFNKDLKYYTQLNDLDFQQISLIGWVFGIQNFKVKYQQNNTIKQQINMIPQLYSNVYYPFKNHQIPINIHNHNNQSAGNQYKKNQQSTKQHHLSNTSTNHSQIRRNLICPKNNYMKNFMKTFNQIFKQSKQYKNLLYPSQNSSLLPNLQQLAKQQKIQWIYCFTSLKLSYYQDKMYFMFTNKTKIISLQIKFYLQYIQNMEKSLGFMYSYLQMPISSILGTNNNSSIMLTPETLEEGYLLTNLQTQASIIDKLSFTGILKDYTIEKKVQGNAGNRKQNQVILTFYEDGLRPKSSQIGLAKVIIKLSANQSIEQIKKYLQIGYVYLIYNVFISISDTVNVAYKLRQKWQNHLACLGIYKNAQFLRKYLSNSQQNAQNQQNCELLSLTQISTLKLPYINRNIIKIRVDLVRLQHLFAKIICTKCKNRLRLQKICNYCGSNQGQMILWAIALACDQTSYVQLSLQTIQFIQFFSLTFQHLQEMRKKCYSLQQTKGNTNKMNQLFNFYDYFMKRTSTQPLLKFQKYMATTFITKQILCTARYNVNQAFNTQLSQQQKLQFQQSLESTKQFMKKSKNKIHFNGHLRKIDKNNKKVVANVRVIQVAE